MHYAVPGAEMDGGRWLHAHSAIWLFYVEIAAHCNRKQAATFICYDRPSSDRGYGSYLFVATLRTVWIICARFCFEYIIFNSVSPKLGSLILSKQLKLTNATFMQLSSIHFNFSHNSSDHRGLTAAPSGHPHANPLAVHMLGSMVGPTMGSTSGV